MKLTKEAHEAGKAAAESAATKAAESGAVDRDRMLIYAIPVSEGLKASSTPEELVGYCRGLLTAIQFSYRQLDIAMTEMLRQFAESYAIAACKAVGADQVASSLANKRFR